MDHYGWNLSSPVELIRANFNKLTIKAGSPFFDQVVKRIYTQLGVCYTFNTEKMDALDQELWVSKRAGTTRGLYLVFNTRHFNYVYDASENNVDAGVRFVIHSPYEPPDVDFSYKSVGVGKGAYVELAQSVHKYLEAPWGSCRPEIEKITNCSENTRYSRLGCMRDCKIKQFHLKICKCVPFFLLTEETKGKFPECLPTQLIECNLSLQKSIRDSDVLEKCKCPLECEKIEYTECFVSKNLVYDRTLKFCKWDTLYKYRVWIQIFIPQLG